MDSIYYKFSPPPYSTPAAAWTALKDLYFTLVTHIIPGPMSLSYFTPFILLPAALLIPPKHLSQRQAIAFCLVPIYAGIFHAWTVMRAVDVISVDALLWSTLFIALKDPRTTFRRLWKPGEAPWLSPPRANPQRSTPTQPSGFVEEPYPEHFGRRVVWVGTLLASTRFHRWKIGEPSHDARQDAWRDVPSRWAFVRVLIPRIAFTFLVYPLLIQLARHDPGIASLSPDGALERRVVAAIRGLVPPGLLSSLLCGLYAYCIIGAGFQVPAPLIVLTNYLIGLPPTTWSPHMLPSYFGPFTQVLDYGVTGLWGGWWHQHVRQMSSAPGRWLVDSCGLSSKQPLQSFVRYCVIVMSGFLFSGITHMGLVPPLVPDANRLRLQIAAFFWIQCFAVIFEAVVVRVWYALGLRTYSSSHNIIVISLLRLIRFTWAVLWMAFSLQLLVLPFDALGWWYGWWLWPLPGLGHLLTAYTSGSWIP